MQLFQQQKILSLCSIFVETTFSYPAVFVSALYDPALTLPGVKVTSVDPTAPFSSFPPQISATSSNPVRCWALKNKSGHSLESVVYIYCICLWYVNQPALNCLFGHWTEIGLCVYCVSFAICVVVIYHVCCMLCLVRPWFGNKL